jgi:4-carboxymuconolactone decarboxylase
MSVDPAPVLVRLSAAVASGDPTRRREALRVAARAGADGAVEEALLQTYLFLGFPAALTALAEWREVSGTLPTPGDDVVELTSWSQRGEAVCRTVYGRSYEKLRGNVRRVHPAMDDWMIQEGYGKVLARPGLDLDTRELCIVAVLSVTGWEPQLHSHLRGALHAGCSPARVDEAMETGLELSADPSWPERARSLWKRVAGSHLAPADRSGEG